MPKKPKINPSEAIKVLAQEMQQIKGALNQLFGDLGQAKATIDNFAAVFDNYINFKKDQKEFVKYLDKLVSEQEAKAKELLGDQDGDGQAKQEDPVADTKNEG